MQHKESGKDQAIQALLTLFNCYNWTGGEAEKKVKLEAYWLVLSELPPHAVISACRKAMRGALGNPAFLPSAPQLYAAAGAVLPRPRVQLLPNGEERRFNHDAEWRKRMAQKWAELAAGLARRAGELVQRGRRDAAD